MLMRSIVGATLATFGIHVLAAVSVACGHCKSPRCYAGAPVECAPTYLERTIYVPTRMTETRPVTRTAYRTEQREVKYTVNVRVPRTEEKTRTVTVMVPETRTKTVHYNVCKPVWETKTREFTVKVPEWKEYEQTYTVNQPHFVDVEQTYTVQIPYCEQVEKTFTVMVPHREQRETTRTVVKCVPVQKTRHVTCDKGHWDTQLVEVPCGNPCGCGSCHACQHPATRTICRRVWIPNVVTEEVAYTAYERVTEQVPHTYTVTVCKPETKTRMVSVTRYRPETKTRIVKKCEYRTVEKTRILKKCEYRTETRTRDMRVCRMEVEQLSKEVQHTVCVPQQQTHTYNVTTYDCVPEERTRHVNVCVPYQVTEEVPVTVCRMVPKQVKVAVGCRCGGC